MVNTYIWLEFSNHNHHNKEVSFINGVCNEFTCNEKCHLTLQAKKKQSHQEQELPELIHSKYEFIIFNITYNENKANSFFFIDENFSSVPINYYFLRNKGIFQPPRV